MKQHNKIIIIILLFMLTNISYIFLISTLLILGGWAFKAMISLAQGKPVEVNFKNPLNLKARWPKEPKEKK